MKNCHKGKIDRATRGRADGRLGLARGLQRNGAMRVLIALIIGGALLAPAVASATVSVTFQSRDDASSPDYAGVTGGEGINIADCETDVGYTYLVTAAPLPTDATYYWEVWVGTSCNLAAERASCTRVFADPTPARTTRNVTLKAKLILAETTGGTTTSCPPSGTGSVTLWVLLAQSGINTAEGNYTSGHSIHYDLDPPAAPTSIASGAGDTRIHVTWTAPTDTINGYYVLCDPQGAGTPSASCNPGGCSAAADGGDAGGTCLCAAGALYAGMGWVDAEPFVCTELLGSTATETWVGGRTNCAPYNVAVVALDGFNNPSITSAIACATAAPVTDFWEAYCSAGGRACATAGCSASGAGAAGGSVALLALGALLFGRRRRTVARRSDS